MNMTYQEPERVDALVVGGGIGGLTAAALLAKAGYRVRVLERTSRVGGRGATQEHEGFLLNLGGHALYRRGEAMKAFRRLGLPVLGNAPTVDGNECSFGGALHELPAGLGSIVKGRLLAGRRLAFVSALLSILSARTSSLMDVSLRDWIDRKAGGDEVVSGWLEGFFRLTGYANAPERQSAGAALVQGREGLIGGVLYLDGGWQQLVDGLVNIIESHGGKVSTKISIRDVLCEGGRTTGVVDGSGDVHKADVVMLATGPGVACRMLSGEALAQVSTWAEQSIAAEVSCLDVVLKRLPVPSRRFVLGLDTPLYYSVHSAYASLQGEGCDTDGEVIHIMKYLSPGDAFDAKATEAELEAFLEQSQPGWRDVVLYRRFLPKMTVSHAITTTTMASSPARGPVVDAMRGLFVVGDWVGKGAMLVDASVASAVTACEEAISLLSGRKTGRALVSGS